VGCSLLIVKLVALSQRAELCVSVRAVLVLVSATLSWMVSSSFLAFILGMMRLGLSREDALKRFWLLDDKVLACA
jgi:hypothetical protein